MRAYFFGCYGQPGHYLWQSNPMRCIREPDDFPIRSTVMDGGLLPRDRQVEGEAVLWQSHNWTILTFWDRSGDSRRNSNSSFLLEGHWDFETAVQLATAAFPKVWERFKFQVYLA